MATVQEDRFCRRCGRRIEWRRKWASEWDQIAYCGEKCRRNKLGRRDREIERALTTRAARAAAGATFCPSEVARAVGGEDWRDWMEPVREAARRLIVRGELEMLQRGSVVDASTARGPIRLRRVDPPLRPAR
ncbi:MAG: DUF2256 and DUF3253 domain-containing protein [bacterium]|nr:DUF2256 and DUF3253 domain-containing protein [bacterium]